MIGAVTSTAAKRIRKDPARRRAEIVDAAVTLAYEIGLDRLTARDIAARMGVAPGLLHHYFPHIDDLIVEAFRQVVATDIAELGEALDELPPMEALTEFLRRSLARHRDTALTIWLSAWVAANRRPKLAAEVDVQMRAGVDLLASLLERGRATGELGTTDSETSAWRILVTLDGIAVQRSIRPAIYPPGDLTVVVAQVAERELGLAEGTLAATDA